MSSPPAMRSGLLYGSRAISDFLGPGWTPRAVNKAVRVGRLPFVFHIGRRLAASREAIEEWIADQAQRARVQFETRASAKAADAA